MNKYLEKIAEKKDGSWMVPAVASTIPTAAIGIARNNDLKIDLAHARSSREAEKLLTKMKMNKKTTAALAGLGITATGIAEASRRRFFAENSEQQNKKLENQIVKKIETTLQSN
ncbi:MAG TPA: hypothetical protein VFM18_00485 [Methanosarcina sp.]|nr:hypothetical protein [Methanosarcina sp.]